MDDRQSLEQLVSQGEGQTLEFKEAVPTAEHLARLIAAFANSGGGKILLGVRDDGSISGVSSSYAEVSFRSALQRLTPQPECLLTAYSPINLRTVVRIDVAEEPAGPVTVPDGVFRRSGDRLEALPSAVIRERTIAPATSDFERVMTPLAGTLETLTQRVLDLEATLIEAHSWRRRLPDMLIGAAISALLGLALALLFLQG